MNKLQQKYESEWASFVDIAIADHLTNRTNTVKTAAPAESSVKAQIPPLTPRTWYKRTFEDELDELKQRQDIPHESRSAALPCEHSNHGESSSAQAEPAAAQSAQSGVGEPHVRPLEACAGETPTGWGGLGPMRGAQTKSPEAMMPADLRGSGAQQVSVSPTSPPGSILPA